MGRRRELGHVRPDLGQYAGCGIRFNSRYRNYSAATTLSGSFGVPGDIPVIGDWNGDGRTKVGVFRPSVGRWYLDLSGTAQYNSATTITGQFGAFGDRPVVGDWNGDGRTKVGVFRPSVGRWYLDLSGSSTTSTLRRDSLAPMGTLR
jgi:hypothetical protein